MGSRSLAPDPALPIAPPGLQFPVLALRRVCINVGGAIRLAGALRPGKTVVTMLCDSGLRYASTIFDPSWLQARDLPQLPRMR